MFLFQLIILARWQRFATKKITISTYQPGGLEIFNGNGLHKVVGGSSSFFDLD
jgi:hypothetical protein